MFRVESSTSIHYYTSETKRQSKQWIFPGKSPPKEAKMVPLTGKIMDTIFRIRMRIILMGFLEKRHTTTGQYCSELLDRFDEKLKETWPHLAKKKVLFYHDNAPTHSFGIVEAKLHESRYELLPHPPYSPHPAPCDFFLFANMKKWLVKKKFSLNEMPYTPRLRILARKMRNFDMPRPNIGSAIFNFLILTSKPP